MFAFESWLCFRPYKWYSTKPITSHTKKRIQFVIGKPAISSRHVRIVTTGAKKPPGARNARGRSGSR